MQFEDEDQADCGLVGALHKYMAQASKAVLLLDRGLKSVITYGRFCITCDMLVMALILLLAGSEHDVWAA